MHYGGVACVVYCERTPQYSVLWQKHSAGGCCRTIATSGSVVSVICMVDSEVHY